MPAGRNPAPADTAILAFGSAGRCMQCRGADGSAVLRVRVVGPRHGGVSGAGPR